MKSFVHALALAPPFVLGLITATLAQPPRVPPTPTLTSPEACPAQIRFSWDVTSIAGADRIVAEILRGKPGLDVGSATRVTYNSFSGATGSGNRDLREFGPVLDGTRWSEPVVFERDELPDWMASAEALQLSGGMFGIGIYYNMPGGGIGSCADRILYRIDKTDDRDYWVQGTGLSASVGIDLTSYGPGVYVVRVRAAHGGKTPDDAVGRENFPIRVSVGTPAAKPPPSPWERP